MTYYAKAAIVLAVLLAGFVGGWQVRAWQAGSDDAKRIKAEAHAAEQRDAKGMAAATSYEDDKAAQRPKTIIITREVARAVQADPDCSRRALPDGLRDALTDAAAGVDQSVFDGWVPSAPPASPYDLGRSSTGLFGASGRVP